ncbi:MAG: anhydro-N-acetylmuramic acid kinase [Proteobacteria bacterium]|nr:anhydro-N-acetylmuramic acid kinase [Pseudomonadota bacterium]
MAHPNNMKSLLQTATKKKRLVLGVMSGTSLDGIDLALVRFSGGGEDVEIELLEFISYPLSQLWQERIERSFSGNAEELCRINFDLGNLFADNILTFMEEVSIPLEDLDLIGSHGQTIYHIHGHSTLQLGEADLIAARCRTVVISDFRTADIAAGGTGAPLVPYFDSIFFKDRKEGLAIQNLGGMGNVTYLPPNRSNKIIAFDTGPANAPLNELVKIITNGKECFDRDGQISSLGVCDFKLLNQLLQHPYFHQELPKSTGREQFGSSYVDELLSRYSQVAPMDLLRTLVSLVTHSISNAYQKYLPGVSEIYLCGGGADHPLIFQELSELMKPIVVRHLKTYCSIPSEAKEAVAFALLAHEKLNNTPTNIPSVTGANRVVSLGKISTP